MTKEEEKAIQDDHACLMFEDPPRVLPGAIIFLAGWAFITIFVIYVAFQYAFLMKGIL